MSHKKKPESITPTFEAWVDYCFVQGSADFNRTTEYTKQELAVHRERWGPASNITNKPLAEYLIQLFESPGWIQRKYTQQQIAEGIWFIFGLGSEYFGRILHDGDISLPTKLKCVRSVASMYTQFFDKVCGRGGQDPFTNRTSTDEIDTAVFMIWDMGVIETCLWDAESDTERAAACLDVLEVALTQCTTSSCKGSALHGLGHVVCMNHRTRGHVYQRSHDLVSSFLKSDISADWLRTYAEHALNGNV
jgi:hypothetical protein